MKRKSNNSESSYKGTYLIIVIFSIIYWYKNTVNTSQFETGTIFTMGGSAILIIYFMDYIMDFLKELLNILISILGRKGKRLNKLKAYLNNPIDTPPQTSPSVVISGKIYPGYIVDIALGIFLSFIFIWSTQTYGYIWSGIPNITFATDNLSKSLATAMVFAIENGICMFFAFTSKKFVKKWFDEKKTSILMIIITISAYIAGYFMRRMHSAVYGLDADALRFVTVFFTIGALITLIRGNQIAFDILHFNWNFWVTYSGMNIALGMSVYPITTALMPIAGMIIVSAAMSLIMMRITHSCVRYMNGFVGGLRV